MSTTSSGSISRNDQFEHTFRFAPVGIAHVAPDGSWLRVNRKLCDVLGRSAGELLDLTFQDITHPDDLEVDLEYVRQMLDGQIDTYSMEKRYLHRDGGLVWANLTVSLVRHEDATPDYFISVLEDISDRKHKDAQLRKSEARFRSTFENAAVGIAHVSLDGNWILVNQQLCNILDYTREQLLTLSIDDITHPDDYGTDAPDLRRLLSGTIDTYVAEKRYVRSDGHIVWVNITVSLCRSDTGMPEYFIGVVRDISERKKIAEEREKLFTAERAARAEAEHASRMKDEFLANISHELRTPLTSVLGWASLLTSGAVEGDDVRHGLSVIEQSARAQTQIVEDLLDMSRIITGSVQLSPQRVSIGETLRVACEIIRPSADTAGVSLHCNPPSSDAWVDADPGRLQQILLNLLANAVKFTPDGGAVHVEVATSGGWHQIIVRDTGIGIDPEFLPHVFDRFRQEDSSSTRSHGGLGLGLAIVRHLVELHGGTVAAESPGKGEGAVFRVKLRAVGRDEG